MSNDEMPTDREWTDYEWVRNQWWLTQEALKDDGNHIVGLKARIDELEREKERLQNELNGMTKVMLGDDEHMAALKRQLDEAREVIEASCVCDVLDAPGSCAACRWLAANEPEGTDE